MFYKILNILGLVLNIAGVLMVYFSSPFNFWMIDGGSFDNKEQQIDDYENEQKKKNKKIGIGVGLIVIGIIFQIIFTIFS
jgi:hypothetical protein